MEKENEFKAMTESLRLLHSDEKVGEYLRWIIKSDTSKAYWHGYSWEIEMPELDGDYLCMIERDNECGTTSKYQQVIQCSMNIWILKDKEKVIKWKELSSEDAENITNTYKDPHEVSEVKCDVCNYRWVAVRPEGLTKLECPKCGGLRSFEYEM